jgi:hypothetical protein
MTTETYPAGRAASAAAELRAATGTLPCAARPHSGLVHRDGPCRCFVGGPAPEHDTRPQQRVAWAPPGAA